MPQRREHGSGSVYQRADGRWVGSFEAGYTSRGTRRRITVTAATKPLAVRKLRDRRLEVEREGVSDAPTRTTVKAWSDQWLESITTKVRPTTLAAYRASVRKAIVPAVGHRRLDQLTPKDVRAVRDQVTGAGLSTTTAGNAHRALMTMLRAAVVEGHAVPQRVFLVTSPAPRVNDRQPMTVEQALKVIALANHLPHGTRWLVAILHGLRRAEALGLTWDALDLEGGSFVIHWQLQSLPYIDRSRPERGFRVPDGYDVRHLVDAWHLTRPKTQKGWRVAPMVGPEIEALRAWRDQAPDNPWGLVWPTVDGRPANDKSDREEWQALQATVGVAHPSSRFFHIHEARDGYATALLEAGVDPHVITALMGHSSIVTSRAYMHVDLASARLAQERVARIFRQIA